MNKVSVPFESVVSLLKSVTHKQAASLYRGTVENYAKERSLVPNSFHKLVSTSSSGEEGGGDEGRTAKIISDGRRVVWRTRR